ncbi:MAG: hypothetical protein U0841_26240 [Chloroflexia bacterium]
MKYMFLIYGDENALSESERVARYKESSQLVDKLAANAVLRRHRPLASHRRRD